MNGQMVVSRSEPLDQVFNSYLFAITVIALIIVIRFKIEVLVNSGQFKQVLCNSIG